MPNQKGGKKFKRGKKPVFHKRELIEKDPKEHQEYSVVRKVLGSGRYELLCQDGITRIGICRGTLRKRTKIIVDDILLIALWVDLQDDKCSIIHKYDEDEIHKIDITGLRKEKEFEEDDDLFDYNLPSDDEKEEITPELKLIPTSSSEEEEVDIDEI